MAADESVPPGWDRNPSARRHRLPLVALALVGAAVAAYLAAFQFGLVHAVWDPLFGAGSRRVLTSPVADTFPVPDASLGAAGYLLDAVSGLVGGPARWRDRPWLVVGFGTVVTGMAAVSVGLVLVQAVVVEAWCTLCLASAAISLTLVGPATGEVLATLQHLRRARDRGASVASALWGVGLRAGEGSAS
ncbi:MAG: vitamin K epoxide reductase family protein [Haloarculaceae archaeon]